MPRPQDRLRVFGVLVVGSLLFLIAGVAALVDVRRILEQIGMR